MHLNLQWLMPAVLILVSVNVWSDNNARMNTRVSTDVAAVTDARYQKECGVCHFAYQPGLLPARSWQKLMGTLNAHFGDNAELNKEATVYIANYLEKNAADKSSYRRSIKIITALKAGETPLRISDMAYFKREHDEVPKRLVQGNSKVGSISNCTACHHKAETGSYSEDEIWIPGMARGWER